MTGIDGNEFQNLVERLRQGDQDAATLILDEYEPQIRRIIRLRLTDSRLRRVFDSTDICQSVFANFFARAAIGQFDIKHPEKLLALLITMAKNKLIQRHRYESVRRPKGMQRIQFIESEQELPAQQVAPSAELSLTELVTKVSQSLNAKERTIATMRKNGMPWASIAQQLGESQDAIRKQFERSMQRAVDALELE